MRVSVPTAAVKLSRANLVSLPVEYGTRYPCVDVTKPPLKPISDVSTVVKSSTVTPAGSPKPACATRSTLPK